MTSACNPRCSKGQLLAARPQLQRELHLLFWVCHDRCYNNPMDHCARKGFEVLFRHRGGSTACYPQLVSHKGVQNGWCRVTSLLSVRFRLSRCPPFGHQQAPTNMLQPFVAGEQQNYAQ